MSNAIKTQEVPTREQFRFYRALRRQAVRNIVVCLKAGTIGPTPWADSVIAQSRREHSGSVMREKNL